MIEVIKTGMYTSVQDLGRDSYSSMGVPRGGAMDQNAFKIANIILGNHPNDAALEITMMGPVLKFHKDTFIATSGAKFELFLDDQPVANGEAIVVKANQVLRYGKRIDGIRAYLAISGGIQSECILGSRSYLKNITSKVRLEKGMELPYLEDLKKPEVFAIPKPKKFNRYLDVYQGPEYHLLTHQQKEQIQKIEFKVSHLNDRMAYQLEPNLNQHQISQITVPVLPGSVQLTPIGSLIVLMRDGQTTGGYPRVLQVTEESIDLLAQMATSSTFKFRFLTKFKDSL